MPKKNKKGIKKLITPVFNFKNKNKKSKQIIVSVLAIIMIFVTIGTISSLFNDSYAADIASGTSGTCIWNIDADGKLTIEPDSGDSSCTLVSSTWENNVPWYQYASTITSVEVKDGVKTHANAAYLFYKMQNATEIDVTKLDTSSATTMYNMFDGCSSLTSLDVTNFNTSSVIDMEHMFEDCSSLISLDVTNFNTSSVRYMNDMFNGCKSLTSLDLTNFNTSSAIKINYMFSGCESLTSLDLSNFNTSSVTDMRGMFQSCISLTNLDVTHFNTSNVKDIRYMFSGCFLLKELDLSNFDMSAISSESNVNSMFTNIGKNNTEGCKLILNNTFNNITYTTNNGYKFPWAYYAKETNGTLSSTLYSLTDMQSEVTGSSTPTTWVPAYSITYDKNNGDDVSGTPNPKVQRIGANVNTTGYNATKSNSTFNNWNTSANGGGTTFNIDTASNTTYGAKYGASGLKNGNVTLYAQFTTYYTLTVHANGGTIPQTTDWTGSGNTATKQVIYGKSVGALPEPTRTDYVFDGWSDTEDGPGMIKSGFYYYASEDMDIYAQWYNGIAKGTSGTCDWTIDHDGKLTIYAESKGNASESSLSKKDVSTKDTVYGSCQLGNSEEGQNPYPWHEYKTQITSVEVGEGVSAAENSTGLFEDLTNVTEINASNLGMSTSYNSTDLFKNIGSNLIGGTKVILNSSFSNTCTDTWSPPSGPIVSSNKIKDRKPTNLANGDQCDPLESLPWNYYAKEENNNLGNDLYTKSEMYDELGSLENGASLIFVPAYTITYDKGSGNSTSGTPNPDVYRIGTKVNTTGYSAAKEKNTFNNWNTKLDGSGTTLAKSTQTNVSFGDKYSTTGLTNGNVTVYAQYSPNTFTPAIIKTIENEKSLYKTGDTITYNIKVTNNESYAITNVVVSDPNATITSGTGYTVNNTHQATISSIAAGESVTITATKTITTSDVNTVTNTATITEAEAANGATLEGKPSASKTSNVQNVIKITKQVKGNMAKLNEYFKVKVVIGGATGDKYTISGQSYTGEGKQTTYTVGEDNYIYLKSGETITIGEGASDSRILAGTIYRVVESSNDYNTYINGSSTNDKDSGDLTTSTTNNTNEISIINTKEAAVLTAKTTKYIPYMILIIVGILVAVFIILKKEK